MHAGRREISVERGHQRPGRLWWLLLLLATGVGGYGLTLQDARARAATVPGLPWLDVVHFAAGGVAMMVGVWAFRRDVLARRPALHRRLGQIYIVTALASGSAGLLMACFSAGGLAGHLGFAGLGIGWLATTMVGFVHIHRRGDIVRHRRWMVRSYALCCAAITLRLELPLLVLATGSFATAFAIVAWACWVPNVLLAEWWLARTTTAGRWR